MGLASFCSLLSATKEVSRCVRNRQKASCFRPGSGFGTRSSTQGKGKKSPPPFPPFRRQSSVPACKMLRFPKPSLNSPAIAEFPLLVFTCSNTVVAPLQRIVCPSRKYRQYSGSPHYGSYCHCPLPMVPVRDKRFTGAIKGNYRDHYCTLLHYSAGSHRLPLLSYTFFDNPPLIPPASSVPDFDGFAFSNIPLYIPPLIADCPCHCPHDPIAPLIFRIHWFPLSCFYDVQYPPSRFCFLHVPIPPSILLCCL